MSRQMIAVGAVVSELRRRPSAIWRTSYIGR